MKVTAQYIIAFAILANVGIAKAQNRTDSLQSEQVNVVKGYEPVLLPSSKVNFSPDLPKITEDQPEKQQYQFTEKFAKIEYKPEDLKPLKYTESSSPDGGLGFLKLGFGNYLTPLIQAGIANKHQTDFKVGLNTDFIHSKSSKNKFQQYYEFGVNAYAAYQFRTVGVGLDLSFEKDQYHFYGQPDSILNLLEKDDVSQAYNNFDSKLYFKNAAVNRLEIDYYGWFGIGSVTTNNNQKVTNVKFGANGVKEFGYGDYKLGLNLDGLSSSYRSDNNFQQFALQVTPYAGIRKGIWQLEAGPVLIVDAGDIYALPYIKNRIKVAGENLVIYNEWLGKLVYNNLATAYKENPFISSNIRMDNYRFEERNFIGVKGATAFGIAYDVRFSQLVWQGAPLWLNDSTNFSSFIQVYDEKVKALNPHIELSYRHKMGLDVGFAFDYYKFSTTSQPFAWHMPEYKSTVHARYTWNKQLTLGADLYVLGGMKARNEQFFVENMKPMVDINFNAYYALNKNIGFFANANNVASIKNPRWFNYPGYGFQILGGLKVLF